VKIGIIIIVAPQIKVAHKTRGGKHALYHIYLGVKVILQLSLRRPLL
jgi:hypothetical protein